MHIKILAVECEREDIVIETIPIALLDQIPQLTEAIDRCGKPVVVVFRLAEQVGFPALLKGNNRVVKTFPITILDRRLQLALVIDRRDKPVVAVSRLEEQIGVPVRLKRNTRLVETIPITAIVSLS